jgi:VWFA-related protein
MISLVKYGVTSTLMAIAVSCCDCQGQATFETNARFVRVPVVVTDATGGFVVGLNKSDFDIFDSGVPQDICCFWRESAAPLVITIVLDTSGTQLPYLIQYRATIIEFLKSALRPGDQGLLITFDSHVRLAQDRTFSYEAIGAILNKLGRSPDNSPRNFGQQIGEDCVGRLHISGAPCGNSIIWNAIYATSQKVADYDGRKIMLLLTDGNDSGSDRTLDSAIRAAQQSCVVVFPIGLPDPFHHKLNRRDLTRIAKETGGTAFLNQSSIVVILDRLNYELRSQYLLGYTPRGVTMDGAFHRIKVGVRVPGKVSARSGYVAKP